MEKRLTQFLIVAILAFGLLAWWDPFWARHLHASASKYNSNKVTFTIEPGNSATLVASRLKDMNLIVSEKTFLRHMQRENLSKEIRQGSFRISPNMSTLDIVEIITTDGVGDLVLTILEGWTINDIDALLTRNNLINKGEFRHCAFTCQFDYDFLPENLVNLEGFLFPDTYFVDPDQFETRAFMEVLLRNFESKLSEEILANVEKEGRDLYEVINVASMLEKEVRTEKDLPIVSGIIWKRLDNNWTLGIDATILYVQEDNILTVEDLKDPSPYNTRLYAGLPPTPIGNPGIQMIEAASAPVDSEYWFYITTLDTGEVKYGRTNEEHNANIAKYLR